MDGCVNARPGTFSVGKTILPAPHMETIPPDVRSVASPISKSANRLSIFAPHALHCNVQCELNLYQEYLVCFGRSFLRSTLQLGQEYRDHIRCLT